MSIYKLNSNDTTTHKISDLNDMVIEVSGQTANSTMDEVEIAELYTQLAALSGFSIERKYSRNQYLGHTLGTYTGWTHAHEKTGYSIWSITVADYIDNINNQLYFDDRLLEKVDIESGETEEDALALTNQEILDESWKWCSNGTTIYVTIRNAGNTSYEGNYYITASSSATNKQNFFISNHEYKSNYRSVA